ncbi:hypothetical protein [Belliella aquatica]|uniref:hypothetical protein n=1 Tax=Belliella aquatica TaxID=1323734 RepID=UPI00166A883F|nr:hypothetical protein [Belliella aquatica]
MKGYEGVVGTTPRLGYFLGSLCDPLVILETNKCLYLIPLGFVVGGLLSILALSLIGNGYESVVANYA